nr:MAG TPA: hypothetical protein [Caudoviricetes sp.]
MVIINVFCCCYQHQIHIQLLPSIYIILFYKILFPKKLHLIKMT